MCKHCGHPIGYHWLESDRCSCKGCLCPGYEPCDGERMNIQRSQSPVVGDLSDDLLAEIETAQYGVEPQ